MLVWVNKGREIPLTEGLLGPRSTGIGKKADLFAKLQAGRARKRINATRNLAPTF